ncbi:MAG: J domain-containing protein [Candidatus Sungbacteria bacterium]|nr:J domain-containing protein [bacterium]MDZ4260081.1 J domain-containing protein [Candidatus Sungbacteria bacterium]
MNPVHGVDYLIDYYVILRVKHDADLQTIKKAYHDQQLLYHPDRYEHLAPEFRNQAEERSRTITDAYEILSDLEKRTVYNEKLAHWKGSISKDGMAIVDPTKPYFSCSTLLFPSDQGEIEKLIAGAMNQISGYNPETFEVIEALFHATQDPSDKIRKAYQEQLAKKDTHLLVKENMAWATIGFHNQPMGGAISLAHAKEIAQTIEQGRQKIGKEVARTLMMLGTGELKAIGPAGEELEIACTKDPEHALQIYYAKAIERFGAASEEITAFAQERIKVTEKRLDSIRCEYIPADQPCCSRLILVARIPECTKGFHFRLKDKMHVVSDTVLSPQELEQMDNPAYVNQWIEQGYSVMFMEMLIGIDAMDQIKKFAQQHFEDFLKKTE